MKTVFEIKRIRVFDRRRILCRKFYFSVGVKIIMLFLKSTVRLYVRNCCSVVQSITMGEI
jgi:hypothetical protein